MTKTTLRLLDLPQEVVLEVLNWVDCLSLLECRLVCTPLRGAIDNEPSLQLLVELRRSGLSYHCGNDLRCVEVVRRLQQLQRNWKVLEWTGQYSHDIHGGCNAYELVDGLFVKTDSEGGILILELPTTRTPTFQVLADEQLEFRFGDFTLDATQDLIVFLRVEPGLDHDEQSQPQRRASLRLLSISERKAHPEAAQHSILLNINADAVWGQSIHSQVTQIAGDALGLFVRSGAGGRLRIWNWKSGILIGDSQDNQIALGAHSFTFVSPELFYVTTIEDPGIITLYSFDASGEGFGFTHVASLILPFLQEHIALNSFGCHAEQYRANQSSRTPATLLKKQLHSFSMTYMDTTDLVHFDYRMFAPASLFLNYYALYLKRGSVSPILASWDDWGPSHTRFLSAQTSYNWLRYVHGQRLVMPFDGDKVEVWDFNTDSAPSSSPAASDPTILPRANIFEHMVVSGLPHSKSTRSLKGDYHGLLVDNDRIVALSADITIHKVTVFTF